MKKLGLVSALSAVFLLAIPNGVMADGIVVKELGLGKAKKSKSSYYACGSAVHNRWYGGPVLYFTVFEENASLSCEAKIGSTLQSYSASIFNDKVRLSKFSKLKVYESPYLSFDFLEFDFQYIDRAIRKSFGYKSEIQRGRILITKGIYCGRNQTERAFKDQISKIRWEFQQKRSSQPSTATSPKSIPTGSNPPSKVNDSSYNVEERLEAIKRLLDKGLISEDEAKAKRQEILSKM